MPEHQVIRRLTIYRNQPGVMYGVTFYDWRKHLFEELARRLRVQGMDVVIEDRETFETRPAGDRPTVVNILDSMAILYDEDTGNYSVLDCHDNVTTSEVDLFIRDNRCTHVLKCQYRARAFQAPGSEKVKAWTYFDRFWPQNEDLLVTAREPVRHIDKMYFRGADWGRRADVLSELKGRGLTNPDFTVLEYADYVRESTAYRVMLSLPGMADFCNRDIECFGSGACVLRPKLINEVYDELVPDYHYVSIDMDYWGHGPVVLADKIEQRFREIIGDLDYLAFVAGNAARWYDRNVRVTVAIDLTMRQLGLARAVPGGDRLVVSQ
jgi:hypothetical protein